MRYALAAVILAAATGAHSEALPAPVQAAVAEARASCQPEPTRIGSGFIRRQDVNGDGIPDYVLSYEAVSCPDTGHLNCGSAGCLTQVFASTGAGYTKVLDENVQEVRFRTIKRRPAMLLGLHGSSCGKAGSEACGATLYWNGAKFSPAH
ncbi:hypothetical protein [Methylobacterium sp. NEAU K]|uniref:hypothetical protein n=1 Tax=Methylobacterium sp. NEAU K TaxID=3064946 RepID=UPI0027324305|nr:hypothetical protein [Methylobacterium sp. NEAU K]MDP4005345.1 hypothetical protein [Methylobacterium sp. NEAU K]